MTDYRMDRFQEALDGRGPAIELWPAAERAGAATLLVSDDDARRRHAEAERLGRLLHTLVATAPLRPGATERVLAGLAARRRAVVPDPLHMLARPRAAVALTMIAASMFALGAFGGGDIAASLAGDNDADASYAALTGPDTLPAVFEGN